MTTVTFDKKDEVHVKISCEDAGVLMEISEHFTFFVEGYRFMPSFRAGQFDGRIRLFNRQTRCLPYGLMIEAAKMLNSRGYSLRFGAEIINDPRPSQQSILEWIETIPLTNEHGEELVPHDYQIDAVLHSLSEKRSLIISPTGSGKSLIIYLMLRWFLDHGTPGKKILIVVPTTSLVAQLSSDFGDYCKGDPDWSADDHVHQIYSGKEKETGKDIVISTWQSAVNMKPEWFDQFGMILGDEAHLFKAVSLGKIMANLKHAAWRIGTTGTLDGSLTNERSLVGHFGPIHRTTTTHDLIQEGKLSAMTVDCLVIDHAEEDRKVVCKFKYMEEIDTIVGDKARNRFIVDETLRTEGNTIVLFNRVENHGKPLLELFLASGTKRPIHYISGETKTEERERIRHLIETQEDAILVASFGTCSTGLNIKSVHNIVFAAPNKSQIRVLQSIGRGLRKAKNGQPLKVIDISDDYSWKKTKNHTLNHALHRINIYAKEKFPYTTRVVKL